MLIIEQFTSGKYGVLSRNGKAYMIVFVDDYSRAIWCYFIRHKSEALNSLKQFIREVVVPHNIKIEGILGGPALQEVNGSNCLNLAVTTSGTKIRSDQGGGGYVRSLEGFRNEQRHTNGVYVCLYT